MYVGKFHQNRVLCFCVVQVHIICGMQACQSAAEVLWQTTAEALDKVIMIVPVSSQMLN